MPVASRYSSEDHGYVLRVLLALDRLGNAVGGGDDRETISERTGRHLGESDLADSLAVFLDAIDLGHVIDAIPDLTPDEREQLTEKLNEAKRRIALYAQPTQEPQAP